MWSYSHVVFHTNMVYYTHMVTHTHSIPLHTQEECTAWVSRSIKDVLPVLRTYNTHALPYLLRSLLALRVIDEGEGGEGGEGGDGGDEGNVLQHAAAAVGVVLDAVMVHGIQTHDWRCVYVCEDGRLVYGWYCDNTM